MSFRAPSRRFPRLWSGYTISVVGSQVTVLALPLTAILVLGGGATQTGILVAARTLPIVLVGPLIGVYVDRHPRRPVLVASALASALVIGSVPVAAVLHLLTLAQLYLVALLAGGFAVAAQLAQGAIVPGLVGREELVRANARLQSSDSVAQVAGPSLGGALVQALTAPVAMAVDAVSFVASAMLFATIHIDERSTPRAERRRFWHEIADGLASVRAEPILMRAIVAIALANIEWFAVQAILVVYATNDLALSPAVLGLALAAVGPFSILGSVIAGPVISRYGLGPTMILGLALEAASRLVLPFAGGGELRAAAVLAFTQALVGLTVPFWSISFRSLLQAVTPDRLLGRVTAASNVMQWSVSPPAALLAGIAATAVGMRPTILVAGLIALVAVTYLVASPVRSYRSPSRLA
ncbi:MAG: MFS transporter [Chloroflexota bacterium]|nr:MFS transporter [Chloroflexota bacterium]MDE3101515.1 MFS transporter [Chloroflexota bacterium]